MQSKSPSKLLKIPSKESDVWTSTGSSIVNVDIPSTIGYCNLDDTLLLLEVNVPNFDTGPQASAVRPVGLGKGLDFPAYDSDCFIRNCHLESETAGRLDDIQNPNLINQNMRFYSRSTEGRKSASSYNGSFLADEYGFLYSTFRDISKLSYPGQVIAGSDPFTSKSRLATLPIPLKSLCPFAKNMRFYPNRLMGNTRLEIEFENGIQQLLYSPVNPTEFLALPVELDSVDTRDQFELSSSFRFVDPKACSLYQYEPITIVYKEYDAGTTTGGPIEAFDYFTTRVVPASFPNPTVVTGVTTGTYNIAAGDITGSAAGTGATFDVTVGAPDSIGNQKVEVTNTAPGTLYVADEVLEIGSQHWGNAGNNYRLYIQLLDVAGSTTTREHKAVITKLEHSAIDGVVKIDFTPALPAVSSVLAGDIKIQMSPLIANQAPDWEIQKVQLTVPQLFPAKADVDSFMRDIKETGIDIAWFTWEREPQNLNGGSLKFDRQFTLPPNTGNVIVLNALNDSLISQPDNILDFRFRINGVDATIYDIETGSSFYYDTIVQTWSNLGMQLNNLLETGNEEEVFTNPVFIMPTVVPLLPESGFFSLRFRAGAAMVGKDCYAYKHVQKVLRLTANDISIQ